MKVFFLGLFSVLAITEGLRAMQGPGQYPGNPGGMPPYGWPQQGPGYFPGNPGGMPPYGWQQGPGQYPGMAPYGWPQGPGQYPGGHGHPGAANPREMPFNPANIVPQNVNQMSEQETEQMINANIQELSNLKHFLCLTLKITNFDQEEEFLEHLKKFKNKNTARELYGKYLFYSIAQRSFILWLVEKGVIGDLKATVAHVQSKINESLADKIKNGARSVFGGLLSDAKAVVEAPFKAVGAAAGLVEKGVNSLVGNNNPQAALAGNPNFPGGAGMPYYVAPPQYNYGMAAQGPNKHPRKKHRVREERPAYSYQERPVQPSYSYPPYQGYQP